MSTGLPKNVNGAFEPRWRQFDKITLQHNITLINKVNYIVIIVNQIMKWQLFGTALSFRTNIHLSFSMCYKLSDFTLS